MSEIKGQLLGIVMVLLIFGTISSVVAGVFVKLRNTITSQSENMITNLEGDLNAASHNGELLHFQDSEVL